MKNLSVHIITIAFTLTLLAAFGTHKGLSASLTHAQASAPSSAASRECPLQTPEEWQEFLETYAANEKWVETCEDSPCDEDYAESVRQNVARMFERCGAFLDEHPAIARCTSNMRRFVPAWLRQHDQDSYGFTHDNHDYLAAETAADKPPGMMSIPRQLIEALPDRAAVEAVARKYGLKYLTHDSALKGSRTFVLIQDPKGRFDQWMLLNLNDKGETALKTEMPFSIMAVQKADKDGNKLPHVRLFFRDYTMDKDPRGKVSLTLFENNNGKCYSCHSNGVRQLIPRHTPILSAEPVRGEAPTNDPEFAYKRLMEFNRRLRSYGTPDWAGEVNPADNGPMLGKEQGCVSCHNGESRNSLSVFTSHVQLKQKVLTELSMPPDVRKIRLLEHAQLHAADLTPSEAAKLDELNRAHGGVLDDFENSRLPALKKWFLEASCR